MVHILNYLNVSNRENLDADSGFVFQTILMKEILVQRPNWRFTFVCPENTPPLDERISLIHTSIGRNKLEVRFNFPWNELEQKLGAVIQTVDILHINQPELTTSFKALSTFLGVHPKILTYFHFLPLEPSHQHFGNTHPQGALDYVHKESHPFLPLYRLEPTLNVNGLGINIALRHIDAMLSSDVNVTCSQFGENILFDLISKVGSNFGRFIHIPPPISFSEHKNSPKRDTFTILYNHRLYSSYGTRDVFGFLQEIYDSGIHDFTVLVTDPTHMQSDARRQLDPTTNEIKKVVYAKPFVEVCHSRDRRQYHELVSSCHIGLAPHKPSALWSMSVVDGLGSGVPVLCPSYACFPELVKGMESLLFGSTENLTSMITDLKKNQHKLPELGRKCRDIVKPYSTQHCAKRFIELYESLMGDK